MGGYCYGAVKAEATAIASAVLDEVEGTAAALIAAREDLLAAITELRIAADELEQRALKCWPSEGFEWEVHVEGLGVFHQGKKANQYVWDHPGAGRAVIKASMGRIDHPNDVLDLVLEHAAVTYWRLEKMKARGVDGYLYRETIPGRTCIVRA